MATNYVKIKNKPHIIMHREGEVEMRYEKLEPGIYNVEDVGSIFRTVLGFKKVSSTDNLIKFKSGTIADVVGKAESFFSERTGNLYKSMGITRKMGIVMYGPPGTGKTATAMLIMTELSNLYNAICLDMTNNRLSFIKEVIHEIRSVQSNPIVVFVDEVETVLKNEENDYLTFLDGVESVSDFIYLGCTNFFDKIPRRIRERRSRLKHTIEIKSLPMEIYKQYVREKIKDLPESEVTQIAYLSEDKGLTIDELKNSLIDYYIDGVDLNEAIDNAKTYSKQNEW